MNRLFLLGLCLSLISCNYLKKEVCVVAGDKSLPELVFSSDSLKMGIKVYIKFIHAYPNENLSCDNGIITTLSDRSEYDFAVIPLKGDSIRFYYDCIWCPSKGDTIRIPVSEIDDLSEYGLTEEELGDVSFILRINYNAPRVLLKALPIYE